jgi:hypothetical protein|tara:strand:- start:59 stop:238 length:180 start_codon:yes stop_codon:yes gene_type:complete
MERPDPMICASYGATDVAACRNRQRWLEELYMYDGRDKRDHPMHGLFTGLARKYQQFAG